MIWIASSAPAGGTRREVIGIVPVLWGSVRHHRAEMVRHHQAEVVQESSELAVLSGTSAAAPAPG